MRLQGKRALVTGSSKGIGQAIAIRYAEEGADVVVNYNSDPKGAEETVARIQATGRRAIAIKGDLGSVASVRALVEQGWEALGGLDVLVNNAGVESHAPFWDVTESDYDKVLNINLKGVFFATQTFVNKLRADGPRREGDQHQLGARGAAVPELRLLLRQQGRAEDADPEPRGRTRTSRHHDQLDRAWRDRDADQCEAAERSAEGWRR